MNITPERALTLAELLETLAPMKDGDIGDRIDEAAAILRVYAEIAPKWQAVLDADVVVCMDPETGDFAHGGPSGSWSLPLIIKPAP